jgi:hypothetical protein
VKEMVKQDIARRAMESDDADRLLQIAKEHVALVKEFSYIDRFGMRTWVVGDNTKYIVKAHLNKLIEERDEILSKYE